MRMADKEAATWQPPLPTKFQSFFERNPPRCTRRIPSYPRYDDRETRVEKFVPFQSDPTMRIPDALASFHTSVVHSVVVPTGHSGTGQSANGKTPHPPWTFGPVKMGPHKFLISREIRTRVI